MRRILRINRLAAVAVVFLCATNAAPIFAAEVPLDPDILKITRYKALDDRQDLCAVQDRVRDSAGNPAQISHLQQQFVILLASPDATIEAKEFACRQLALIGDARSVPALAALLPEPKLSHMARFALERIPGLEADKALRDALSRLQGLQKIGVINSLGERRDQGAARLLAKNLSDSDALVAESSGVALGKIGNPLALNALRQARVHASPANRAAITDACLFVGRLLLAEKKAEPAFALFQEIYSDASEHQAKRLAALTGLVAARPSATASLVLPILRGQDDGQKTFALRFVRETADPGSAQAFAAELPKLAAEDQVRVIGALAGQKNAAAREAARVAALAATKASDEDIQLAALKSLRSLGRASDIAVLLNAAAGGGTGRQAVARASLDLMPGKEVDEALMSALSEADARMRLEVIRSLGARSVYAAFESVITAATQESDPAVRLQAFKALSRLAQEKDLSRLMDLLKQTRNPQEQEAAEAAILAICEQGGNESARSRPLLEALAAESSPAVRSSLLRILGGVGGDAALDAIQAALKEEAIRDSAIRVLAAWPDPKPIEDLAKLAQSATDSTQQALCLRGFIRMIALQKDCSPEKRLELYDQALRLARRPDEKKLALAGMAQMEETKVLQALNPYLEDPELQPDAAAATLKVAFATRHKSKGDSLAAIDKVLKLTTSENLRAEALKDKERIDLP
jgi:hypothetical protein